MVGNMDIQDMIDITNECSDNMQERNEVIRSLAQYTSVDALHSITNNLVRKNNQTYFILRATSALHTNDREELKHGYDFMMDILKQMEERIGNENNRPEHLFLSNYAKELSSSEKHKDESHESILEWFYNSIWTPYVISLTRKFDDLTMWNKAYGRSGEGVCIVFDFTNIEYIDSNLMTNVPMMMAYKDCPGYWQTFNILIIAIQKIYNSYLYVAQNREANLLDLKLHTLASMCSFVSSYIKGAQWHDEQEWRIMCTTKADNSDCIKYDERNRPYVEVLVPLSCLKKIIFGPKVDDDIIKEFQQNAQNIVLSPDNIYKSKTPLK